MAILNIVWDKLVHKVSVVLQVHQALTVKWDPQVQLVHLVLLELTVLKVPQVQLVLLV